MVHMQQEMKCSRDIRPKKYGKNIINKTPINTGLKLVTPTGGGGGGGWGGGGVKKSIKYYIQGIYVTL